jgi:hypothetical protein
MKSSISKMTAIPARLSAPKMPRERYVSLGVGGLDEYTKNIRK